MKREEWEGEDHGVQAQIVLGLQVLLGAVLAAGVPPLCVTHH